MELRTKKSFKQTEVGLIPEDWNLSELSEVSTLKGRIGWQGLKKEEFTNNSSQPFLITGMNFKDGEIRWDEVYHVAYDRYMIAKEIQLKQGDVLMTKDGTIGKLLYVDVIPNPGLATLNSHLLLFRPIKNSYYPKYLYYHLHTPFFKKHIENTKSGTTFFGISQESVSKHKLILPTLKEQKAIATALSDVDDLIASLESLITKKQAIKQGAMQQLLTPPHKGGKRLPGFSGEWVEKNLGDFCEITTGKLDANAMVSDGDYRFYTCARKYYFIDKYAFDTEALLVSGNGANVGYVHYYNGKFNAYQRTYVLDGFSSNIHFMKCLLDKFLSLRIDSEKNDGNTPYIKIDTLTDMPLNLPSNNEEQKAIAQILSDMDAEIELLETKKAKYQQLKQGMMQELLTGKTRLV